MVERDDEPVRELRQGYHDRIAQLRDQSLTVLRTAIEMNESATRSILAPVTEATGTEATEAPELSRSDEMNRLVGEIDSEVVGLLALESPVARDLRVILASRDVAQIGLLCVGLGRVLADRSAGVSTIASANLEGPIIAVATAAIDLLRAADAAWAAIDEDLAGAVFEGLGPAREARRAFFAALLQLTDVPIDVALDLGMAARVYDRLIDHAANIAGRAVFAASGQTMVVSPAD